MRILPWCVAALCALVLVGPSDAMAQGVMQRERPDYDAKGLPLGGFRLFTGVALGVSSDDNVYRQDSPLEVGDIFYRIAPRARLSSDWSRHALNLNAGLEHLSYTDLDGENQTNWDVGVNGRLDVVRGLVIDGGGRYALTHEPRSSPDLPGFATEPTEYSIAHGDARIKYQPNRFGIVVGASIDTYDYDSVPLLGGGTLNNNDRDRRQYEFYGVVSYEFSPGYSLFARGSYNDRDFDQLLDRSGVNRDSNGYRVNGGVQFAVTRLLEGEIYGGFLQQKYLGPLPDISGADYGALLTWYASPVLTVQLNASRSISDTTVAGASASSDSTIALNFDYEFRRNIIVQAGAGYTLSDYEGFAREDKIVNANVGMVYLINRYISANARYNYNTRSSSLAGQSFTDNVFTLGVDLHH